MIKNDQTRNRSTDASALEASIGAEVEAAIQSLLAAVQCVQLATLNNYGEPESSSTPYLYENDCFFIFISELAAHTRNLKIRPRVSLLLIEDESRCNTIFARKRLILNANAQFIARDDDTWEATLCSFEQQRGKTIAVLKTLPDFWLVKLDIQSGCFVRGFGQAYQFEAMQFNNVKKVTGK